MTFDHVDEFLDDAQTALRDLWLARSGRVLMPRDLNRLRDQLSEFFDDMPGQTAFNLDINCRPLLLADVSADEDIGDDDDDDDDGGYVHLPRDRQFQDDDPLTSGPTGFAEAARVEAQTAVTAGSFAGNFRSEDEDPLTSGPTGFAG